MNEPTILDLFSGIGGFSLGFERAGFKTIGFSEIDPYACSVLRKHWPTVPNYGDIRNVPALSCNVITGGFPCQPFSIAGRRKGTHDHRHLWPAMLEVIERCQPDFILGENVVNIKNMVLHRCLDDLEQRNYKSKVFDIPSCAVGLPSVERHVWIVAARNSFRFSSFNEICLSREFLAKRRKVWQPFFWWSAQDGYPAKFNGRNLSESAVCRSIKGIPGFMDRIRCVGNAVPPAIAQIFAQALRQFYP